MNVKVNNSRVTSCHSHPVHEQVIVLGTADGQAYEFDRYEFTEQVLNIQLELLTRRGNADGN